MFRNLAFVDRFFPPSTFFLDRFHQAFESYLEFFKFKEALNHFPCFLPREN